MTINPICVIKWEKYKLIQSDWEYFATLNRGERAKFLKTHNFAYKDVPRCSVCDHAFFQGVCGNPTDKRLEGSDDVIDRVTKYQGRLLKREELRKDFKGKLEHSKKLVQDVLEFARKEKLTYYLAYSGGFDSECCLQLFKEGIKEGLVKVIVGNTTTELPDTTRRWKQAEEELGVKFIYSTPERGCTFKSNSIKYGLPLFPRNGLTVPEEYRKRTKKCCGNLKELPQNRLLKKLKVDGVILGLKATEQSYGRKLTIFKNGDWFKTKADDKWRIYPIAYWTIKDQWDFQELEGFKYNEIYNKTNIDKKGFYKLDNGKLYQIRSGCGFCPQTIHSGYLQWLKAYYPKWFDALKKTYNEVAELRKPEQIVNPEGLTIEYPDGITFMQVFLMKNKMGWKETPCGEKLAHF